MFNPFPEYFSRRLPEDYLFRIVEELSEKHGKIPDSLTIRSAAIIRALGLPAGPYSAIEVDQKRNRINPERDRIIAEFLTNHPGVEIAKGVVSLDPRDIYPDGLPKELKEVLDPRTTTILETEYEHLKAAKAMIERAEKVSRGEKLVYADYPITYFRLPGGIDLILKGYAHSPSRWHEIHSPFLKEINKLASIICIEGLVDLPYGESIPFYLRHQTTKGAWANLILEAVRGGFSGLFAEIDARDNSKVSMDSFAALNILGTVIFAFPPLPFEFFQKYYDYLVKTQPALREYINGPTELREILQSLSGANAVGIPRRTQPVYWNGKIHIPFPYVEHKGETSFKPTFLLLGQQPFGDALAAIKLLLMARLMGDGYIPKGPIIDYAGAGHLSTKTFFLQWPHYAMEVVLRTINELMAGRVGNIVEIYRVFENPNWAEIVREIIKIIFYQPERGELIRREFDILEIYRVNPTNLVPSDEEIREIQERFIRGEG